MNWQKDFPILARKINGKSLIYFDNGATTQKPREVIKAVQNYYSKSNANVHRGIHTLAEEATAIYERAREKAAAFIGANSAAEIIFVRNTTEAINLVAYAWGRTHIEAGDEIVTTVMEHHSNFLPWRQLALENGARLKVVDIDDDGHLLDLTKAVGPKTKVVALTVASNVLGTINPLKKINVEIHRRFPEVLVVVDGAQAVPHFPVKVQDLGGDFFAFSAHKVFGPMGVGVLWGRRKVLEAMPPFLFGGGMIKSVTLNNVEYAEVPDKFEAGTPNVAGAVEFMAAIDYLEKIGWENIQEQERLVNEKMLQVLGSIPEVTLFGPKNVKERVGAFSFSVAGVHPHDVAQFLNDEYGIAVRAGQHCAGPLHERLGVPATVRASLAFYNTEEEVETLGRAIRDLIKTFK